jgi:two-component system NtrC family response regulator
MKGRLLIVDDERGILVALKGLFSKEGYEVDTSESGEDALQKVKAGLFHVIITDLSMKGMSGLDLMREVKTLDPECAILMITAYGTQRIAVEAMKAGAEDYLPKPFDNDELRLKVRHVMEKQLLKRAHHQLLEQVRLETGRFEDMVGRSRAMMRVFETIDKVAPTDVTVLVRGESGTGKELVAHAVHFRSPRARAAFVAVNCAAFSRELVESELFGHEKGAFTGAVARREGKFEAADGGTLFLDEIGDMGLETQAKLLRVLQEKQFERIGGNQPLKVDVRIIAATNQDLEAMVKSGRFREDLYYRIKVVEVRIPPLREHPEDIPLLVQQFLKDACERFGTPRKQLSVEAMRGCVERPWKGNVRALRAAIEQAVILSAGAEITYADLLGSSANDEGAPVAHAASGAGAATSAAANANSSAGNIADALEGGLTFREAKEKFVGDWEREFFVRALKATGGNISRAAERTGMYRQSFQQKMRELGITLADLGLAGGREEASNN